MDNFSPISLTDCVQTVCMLPFGYLICQYGCVFYHCYVDDTQLYISVKPGDLSNLTTLRQCLAEISNWMSHNFLQLNHS